jgi:short-subunit dehydrogenase
MAYFKDKTVWITGASSGIGEALAMALAAQGAKLILSARNAGELRRVADSALKAGATSALVQVLDLEDTPSLAGIVQQVLKNHDPVDILINNGGISQRSYALETQTTVDDRLMRVNYLGTVALTKAILPSMLAHNSGHIAVVTSLTGKFGSPLRSGYAASKHALHGFFDSLRAEIAKSPIKITLICPGFVRTRISYNALTGDGSPQGTMDNATEKGISPELLARQTLKAIQQGKEELWIGGWEVIGVYVKRFFPRLFSRLIAKAKVT